MQKFILAGIGTPYLIELNPGLNRIGRNPTNDFRVPDSTISSFHCEIELADGVVTVTDMKSTNGTFIDGQSVQESELSPGQVLRLGNSEFRLESPPAVDVPISIPPLRAPEPEPAPRFLENGAAACLNHAAEAATFRCTRCSHTFCDQCVRALAVAGGKPRYFCTSCDGACQRLALPARSPSKVMTFLGRLTQTIKIRLGSNR